MAAVVIGAILVVTMTGCGGMNVERVSDRVVQGAGVNGAIVEVQHPGAPWVNKIVIRLFVAGALTPDRGHGVISVMPLP